MTEFNAAHVMRDIAQRTDQIAAGGKVVPVITAVLAVFAALATLFAHHSSISGLAQKNEALLYQSRAADQYNYYESKRIKIELNQALLDSGIAKNPGAQSMRTRMAQQTSEAEMVLKKAQNMETQSDAYSSESQRFIAKYENAAVAATLFQVSIVFASITALMRTKVLLLLAGGASLVGIGFFIAGFLS